MPILEIFKKDENFFVGENVFGVNFRPLRIGVFVML